MSASPRDITRRDAIRLLGAAAVGALPGRTLESLAESGAYRQPGPIIRTILADIDQDPQPTDLYIKVSNLRKRDGKEVAYLTSGVQSVIYPWHRITFLEIMVSEEERGSVIDFFRT